MDTLILGVTPEEGVLMGRLAALGWSLYALFLGTAGMPGMTHPFELTISRSDGRASIYLGVAAGVTTFILAGRYFEAMSKRRAGAALRALCSAGTPAPRRVAAHRGARGAGRGELGLQAGAAGAVQAQSGDGQVQVGDDHAPLRPVEGIGELVAVLAGQVAPGAAEAAVEHRAPGPPGCRHGGWIGWGGGGWVGLRG
ncbi:MAG: hypothetical protein ACR2JK_04040 [Geodermatophilaceae bacterium]